MRIKLVTVGKIKEKYFVMAIDEYSKRLRRYCKIEIVEVADEQTPDHASLLMETQIKEKEALRILKHVKDDSYVITLEIAGSSLNSTELADKMNKLGVTGRSDITFIIGGSLGLHDIISQRADFKLSFSKMTFPHQMMRMILLEQIYRSYRINQNEPYHK